MLSKKLKAKIKKTAVNSTLAISAIVVLFVMCVNLDGIINTAEKNVRSNKEVLANSGNQVEITNDIDGINVKVKAEDSNGVTSIEVLQGDASIGVYNFSGINTQEEKTVKLSIPFGETKDVTVKVNGNTIQQESVQNTKYIGTAQDLCTFRDAVNGGNTFAGKSIELINDIDLSNVCSASNGSWTSIGTSASIFQGMFNGNYHTISNLYINTTVGTTGFFYRVGSGYVRNITFENPTIYSTSSNVGVVAGVNNGSIINVTVKGGSCTGFMQTGGITGVNGGIIYGCCNRSTAIKPITSPSTTVQYGWTMGGLVGYQSNNQSTLVKNCSNYATVNGTRPVGGICGDVLGGKIDSCVNYGNVTASGNSTDSSGGVYAPSAGGIAGWCGYSGNATITNCYNCGDINAIKTSNSLAAGIVAETAGISGVTTTVSNCYTTGAVSGNTCGGVIVAKYSGTLVVTNNYWLTGKGPTVGVKQTNSNSGAEASTIAQIQGKISNLGESNWTTDSYGINVNRTPILRWQIPTFNLNVKQTYMHVGETLQLTVDTSKSSVTLGSISWASMDSSIAQVDSTGKVTAMGEGYTTVYAVESQYTLKAMAVINVKKDGAVAIAQTATTGMGTTDICTAILKEDGTVWTVGNCNYGQLGNGANNSSNEPVQVKIDKNTCLTNVVKISAGYSHMMALTEDGKVYSWGLNEFGRLGINSAENRNYATLVVDIDGSGYLSDIVDISAGGYHSAAMRKDGLVYTWGKNDGGQLGVGNLTDTTFPKISLFSDVISVSCTNVATDVVMSSGSIAGVGQDYSIGAGSIGNQICPQFANMSNIVNVFGFNSKSFIKNISNKIYATGLGDYNMLGTGNATSITTFKEITVPASSTVKYIGGCGRNTALLLKNGTIWTVGDNTYGQFSNGTTTSSASFVQAKNADGSYITNAKNIGRTVGYINNGVAGYQNITYIDNDGYVYTSGDNSIAQYGNGTTTSSLYYTRMGVPYMNYCKDDIVIGVNDNYTINKNDLKIEEFNVSIDYAGKTPGTLAFSTVDSNISVDSSTGKVTGLQEGYAKVKVTDTTNNIDTYITVKVVNSNNEQLELGNKFTVGLDVNGNVWTWGSNIYGELGLDSNEAYEDEPLQVETLSNIVDIGAGSYHAVAVDNFGDVYTWGLNNNGQLGNGSTTEEKKPIKVNGLSNIVKVDAYKNITTALDQDGNVYVWGQDYDKTPQLIYTDILDIKENVMITKERRIQRLDGRVVPIAKNIVKVSSNDSYILAVQADGEVLSIDDNDTITKLGTTNVINVSCGNGFSYILDKAQNVYTFGNNASGELGDGTNATVLAPTKVTTTGTEIIAAGEGSHGAVAAFEGSIYTTGLNDKGQLGHGDKENTNTFVLLLNVALQCNVEKIIEQIGESQIVEIGLGITLNLKTDLRENSTSAITIVDNTIASLIKNNNGTYTVTGLQWGRTFLNATVSGEINNEHQEFATNIEVRVVPNGGVTIPQIKSGDDFTIALKSNGELEAWGKNTYGQLGIGNTNNCDEPQKLAELEETIVEIAVGNNHVLALTEEGNIYGWGLNDKGQVGNGTTANQLTQATVINVQGNELSKIIRVEAHGDNSFAINSDGEVWAWGKDFGNKAIKLTDYENHKYENAIDVSTNYYVKADGTAYRKNDLGELIQLEIVGTVRAMDEGTDHAVFLTTEGKAYAIGSNDYGQLGNGSTDVASSTAVAMRKDENVVFGGVNTDVKAVAVEAGDRYTILLTNYGEVYATGLNENGRLGVDLATTNTVTPIKNNNFSNTMLISGGANHAVVALTDGFVYSWGKGTTGELGNRLMKDSSTPVMVGPYIIRTDKKNIVLGKTDSVLVKAYVDYFNILNKNIIDINSISKNTQVAKVNAVNSATAELTQEEIDAGYKAFKIEGISSGTTNIVLTETETSSNGILQVEVLPEAGITISPQVETTSNFVATLKTNGTVWTYGQNTYGELGTGDNKTYDEPQKVTFPEGTVIKQIGVGEYHAVALDTEGNVWTWGRNNFYQLGTASTSESNTPIKVTGIPKVTRITAGTNSVMCVTEDNKLVAWGQDAYGELGNGQNINKTLPIIVDGVHDVLDVQGGKNHYLILKTTGELFTSGSNLYGQLGQNIGDRTRINTFDKIQSNLKFGSISAGQSSNAAITIDGVVYVWGQNAFGNLGNGTKNNINMPTQIQGLTGIVEADVGKTHTILRDYYNENIYLAGTNANGQLGDGTNDNNFTFSKNLRIDDVLRVSAGYTYTVAMKDDGTVWAWGDYNHGSRVLNSRTNSKIPVQIGSDTSSLDTLEIVIKMSEVQSILANSEFRFNLIYEDQNKTSDFSYESLNPAIAEVNQNGNILGARIGSTWVKITDNETGKVSVAIVRVIDNVEGYTVYTSPKVVTGENFVATLKEDGNIDLWGYDESQVVDSDTPYTINVVATYKNLVAGKNHMLALRNDGTIWTAGLNNHGQLGKTGATLNTKLTQVENITNVEKIAAGDNFCVVMDSFGIMYVWGEGYGMVPEVLDTNIRNISYLAAGGKDQIVMVLPSGEVYGQGSILNGTIRNFDRAVKVEVGTDYLLILDINGDVYKYQNGVLNKENSISNAIDISVKDNVNMYQKVNEKVYTWGENGEGQLGLNDRTNTAVPALTINNNDKVYTISAGPKNTYIVDTEGHVYASGANNLGQIGNGTKEKLGSTSYQRTLVHTLVGNRNFDVSPISKILEVNDEEELTIVGNTYNVFKKENAKKIDGYNIVVKDDSAIDLLKENDVLTGTIKAKAVGLTDIDITDKVTGEKVTAIRKVVAMDENRILSIMADGNTAIAQEPSDVDTYIYGYTVDVPMDDDETRVALVIQAKDVNDVISIDNGVTYSADATLDTTVEIPVGQRKITIPVIVKASNNTEFKYELVINRISTNNNVATVKVNGYDAIASVNEQDVYEIVITDQGDNLIKVTSEDTNATVSIRGKVAEIGTQSLETTIPNGKIEVPFKIVSESGKSKKYTLRIYTKEELLKLSQLKVNNDNATLEDELYIKVIADDVSNGKIYAKAKYDTTYVGINGSEKELAEITKTTLTTDDETDVTIEVQATAVIDGIEQTISKTYNLKIYKNKKFSFVESLKVNGETIEEENNVYTAFVPSNINNAGIRIQAKEVTYEITFEEDTTANGTLIKAETLENEENVYSFKVENNDGDVKIYTLKIIRGSTDTRAKKVTVGSGDYVVEAEQIDEKIDDKDVYEVHILSTYNNVDVTVQSANKDSKIDINNSGIFTPKIDVENMDINAKTTLVPFTIKSPDEQLSKDYVLRIITVDDDTTIQSIAVNEQLSNPDIIATLENIDDDTKYEVYLQNAVSEIEIKAIAGNAYSKVSINGEADQIQNATATITLTSSITEIPIKVKSECGTEKTYYLTIYTISDDTSIESVKVNGVDAVWNSVNGRYEIKVDRSIIGYEVNATATNANASIAVNDTEGIHQVIKQVDSEGEITLANLKVTAANGITSSAKKLAIIKKSNNTEVGYVKINGTAIAHDANGNYKVSVKSTVQSVLIEVGAQDGNASVNLKDNVQPKVWKGTKTLLSNEEIYDVFIIAEDGVTTSDTFTITIIRLDGNTNIASVEVTYVKNHEDVVNVLQPLDDDSGSYYLELPKIDEERVALRIILEQAKSTVYVFDSEGQGSLYGYVDLTGEITKVPIKVIAEDGTPYQTYLILEKESNDTTLKELSAQGYEVTQTDSGYEVTVDSKLDKLNITAIPKKPKAKVKVSTEDDYSSKLENKEVDIIEKDEILFEVLAEDGETTGLQSLKIKRTYNIGIYSVKVNEESVEIGDTINVIDNSPASIEIKALNDDAEVYLMQGETVIASGVGTLTVPQTLNEETISEYTIKVQGPGEYSNTYGTSTLKLRKKSTNTNAVIYVDGSPVSINPITQKYEVVVVGESHNVGAAPASDYAKVYVDDEETYSKQINVGPKTTTNYIIKVIAEDETYKEYQVVVYRKNNDATIKEVKLKLDETSPEIILTPLVNGSYYYKVPRNQQTVFVSLEATDANATADINSIQALNNIIKEVDIDQNAEVTNVSLKVIAEDETEVTVNLKLERESNDTSLKEVKYDGNVINQEQDESYTIEVDNRLTSIDISAIPTNANAKVKVVGTDDYLSTLSDETVDITNLDSFKMEVLAEDGETTKQYTVNIRRIFNTGIDELKVDETEEVKKNGVDYTAFVSPTVDNHTIEVKPLNNLAVITFYDATYNELYSGTGTTTLTTSFDGDSATYIVKIQGPTGFEEFSTEYHVTLTKRSQDTSAKVYINDIELMKDEVSQKYTLVTKISNNTVKVETTSDYAKVSIDERPYKLKVDEQNYMVNVRETRQIIAKVLSQNGEEETYVIEIIRLDNNTNITSIKVNDEDANKVTDTIYRKALSSSENTATVKITAEYELSSITATVNETPYSNSGELEFTISLSGNGTIEIPITIISQDGTTKPYTLNIVQNASEDLSLIVKVNGLEADQLDDSSYRIFVQNTFTEVPVNIKANDEHTIISVNDLNSNEVTFDKTLNSNQDITTVQFTAKSEAGTPKDFVLYIIKESNDNAIQRLYVNGVEITKSNGRYVTYIDNALGDPTVKVKANNEYAYVRIGTYARELIESTKVVKLSDERTTTVPIVIYSQSGVSNTEYLDIITTFVVGNIEELIVDDVEITDYDESTKTFTAIVENNITDHEIQVIADNNYVTLELTDSDIDVVGIGNVTGIVQFAEGEIIKDLKLYVTGETDLTQEYTIRLVQKSSNVELSKVKVNDVTLQEEPGHVFAKNIDKGAKKVKIEVIAEYPYATIKVGDTEVKTGSSGTVWLDIEVNQDEITIPVVVTAADGITLRTYNIILTRKASFIKGNVITDNWEDIHIADIYVYRTSDKRAIDDLDSPRELVYYTKSKEDGSYVLELPNADNYDIIFKKLGYLDSELSTVTAQAYTSINAQTIKLKAGDIDENGEIELDDLVEFNDHIGETVSGLNLIYDLNEDGVIDSKDRALIKANYHSKKQVVKWLSADEITLIKPLDAGYVITSEYGYRVDPITHTTSFHTGVDLYGPHHGNIYAVADGEVTWAGVQSSYGNCVEIKHIVNGETIYSFYAHLSQINVSVGDYVHQGDVIGLEGGDSTDPHPGRTTGHHLHFEIRSNSGWTNHVNPHDYLEL